jgi:hypothetical protein
MMTKVEEYVRNNYKKLFKDKPLIIEEFANHFEIKSNKDESPLILSKKILL